MFRKISKEAAIQYLMNNISKDCLKKVFIAVQNKGSCWSWSVHMCFGMYVRNVLREGGFNWGAYTLDNLWSTLIAEAARRVEASKAKSR